MYPAFQNFSKFYAEKSKKHIRFHKLVYDPAIGKISVLLRVG